MWPWAPWSYGKGQDKEKEETKKQPDMAEGQRRPRSRAYYQRSKTEEFPAKASDPIVMDARKLKHPGGARREGVAPHNEQQVGDPDLGEPWEVVEHKDLENLKAGEASSPASKRDSPQEKEGLDESYTALDQALKDVQELQRKQAEALKRVAELEKRNKELKAIVAKKEGEVTGLRSELTASSGPASTLSADSDIFLTPYSSLSENGREHRGLVQTGAIDSDILLRLQTDNETKSETIKSLEKNVNQLKESLKYAQQLEDQNVRLITEEAKHEEENQLLRSEVATLKRKARLSRPLTRSYAREQNLQELAQRYEQQYHEELDANIQLRGKISELEKEIQGQEEVITHIDEADDPDLNVELRRKEQHVRTLQAQVESLQQHSKGQSKHVLQLKQELEAIKLSGEEIDTSWRDMVEQLEEENRKLSVDVGGLHRDKKFMEKSMEAIKARNEKLEPLAQKLQAQLEEMKQKEESARKQVTENSRKECRDLQAENKLLSEQVTKLNGLNDDNIALLNEVKAQARKLEQEKEALQNEVQSAKTEAQLYLEDFKSERSDREVAHGKIADCEKKYAHDVGELKAQLAQMEEDVCHHRERLEEVEQVNQRREKEMRSVLEEASNNQTEVQAKTSQVKQYKKQVDSLKDQVAELTKHSEDLIQEMERVRLELVKVKDAKPKKKPSDADDPSKLAELEGRNKELIKERDKLFRELDKTRKDLAKKTKAEAEKTKKDAEKGKKEAKKKHSDKGITSPEPTEVSKALEGNVSEKEQLRNENVFLREEVEKYQRAYEVLQTVVAHEPKNLQLARSRESSQSPLTSPMVDLPRASDPRQQPPRILEEDEEIEQEKIKKTLDLQFHGHKQHPSFQSMEEQVYTAGAGTLPGQAILKANAQPVQYAHGHPPPPEYYREHPHPSGFEAQQNVRSGTDIGPAAVQVNDELPPPPRPPKPSPTSSTISPCDSEMHQLPHPHAAGPFAGGPLAGGPKAKPPYSQQILRDSSLLGAPGIAPQARRTHPMTPPVHHCNESHPLSSQYPPQYGMEMPPQKPIANQRSVGGDIEQRTLVPQGQQGDRLQGGSGRTQSSHQQRLKSPQEDQYQTGQHPLSAPLPVAGPVGSEIQQNTDQCEAHESYEGGSRSGLDQNLESIIQAQAETVKTEVGDESSRRLTMQHIPYDPNLTCPMCNKRFRIGEIQKYRAHVKNRCVGSQEVGTNV